MSTSNHTELRLVGFSSIGDTRKMSLTTSNPSGPPHRARSSSYLEISGCKRAMSFKGIYGGLLIIASNFLDPSNGRTDSERQKNDSERVEA